MKTNLTDGLSFPHYSTGRNRQLKHFTLIKSSKNSAIAQKHGHVKSLNQFPPFFGTITGFCMKLFLKFRTVLVDIQGNQSVQVGSGEIPGGRSGGPQEFTVEQSRATAMMEGNLYFSTIIADNTYRIMKMGEYRDLQLIIRCMLYLFQGFSNINPILCTSR